MTEVRILQVNNMISLYLLLWFLLLKSGSTDSSLDDDSCSIRFYSRQYFQGKSWTLNFDGDWKSNTNTLLNHPIGSFLPKSLRTYGNTNKCKQGWRVCPYGAIIKRRTGRCRKLRHGQALTSISRAWGWNGSFLGLVRRIDNTFITTTSEPAPYPSIPLKVPKTTSINRNIEHTESMTIHEQNSVERNEEKEQNRSSSRSDGKKEI